VEWSEDRAGALPFAVGTDGGDVAQSIDNDGEGSVWKERSDDGVPNLGEDSEEVGFRRAVIN
jgi:hypothetical protein